MAGVASRPSSCTTTRRWWEHEQAAFGRKCCDFLRGRVERLGGAGIKISAIGRGDKKTTVELTARQLGHYRHNRARSGRVLEPKVKRAERFEN